MDADLLSLEDCLPDCAKLLLQIIARRRAPPADGDFPTVRLRERFAIRLPSSGKRQGIEDEKTGGYHVVRQIPAQPLLEAGRRKFCTCSRNEIRRKFQPRAPVARRHSTVRHIGMPRESLLDFPQLDAVTANLDLMIRTTMKTRMAVGP